VRRKLIARLRSKADALRLRGAVLLELSEKLERLADFFARGEDSRPSRASRYHRLPDAAE
jgi:hypothetical protein